MMNIKSIASVLLALGLGLSIATPANAVIIPDGTQPYGQNAYCYVPEGIPAQSTADAVCSAIPTASWEQTTIPESTPGAFTNAAWGRTAITGAVVNQGSIHWSDDPSVSLTERAFFVAPTNPAQLPLLATTDLQVFGHNAVVITINKVSAYAVVDDLATVADPFEAEPGQSTQTVPAGSTYPVALTSTGEGTWSADVMLPTATFTRSTDGVLNGYGWAFNLTTVVEMTVDGQPETWVDSQHYIAFSSYFADIINFHEEYIPTPGEIGVAGSAYHILLQSSSPATTPVNPPVVSTPTTPTVPVSTPPTPPTPETQNPRVNTGDVEAPALWGVGVLALLTAVAGFFVLRGRKKDEPA